MKLLTSIILILSLAAQIMPQAIAAQAPHKREVRMGRVQDMVVFKGEVYVLVSDTMTSANPAAIYKYVDEKTPPIQQLAPSYGALAHRAKSVYDTARFVDRVHTLISFAEHNGELYAGGPLGVFKLNEPDGTWHYIDFEYAFEYSQKFGVTAWFVKEVAGQLYGILRYWGTFKRYGTDETTEQWVDALGILGKDNTWHLARNPHSKSFLTGGFSFGTGLEYLNGQFFVGTGWAVSVLLEEKDEEEGSVQFWNNITADDKDWELQRFTKIAVSGSRLYAGGDAPSRDGGLLTGGRVYVLSGFYTNDRGGISGDWLEVADCKQYPQFLKDIDGRLFVGAVSSSWYDGQALHREEGADRVAPLYIVSGDNDVETIGFKDAPGLSANQLVDGVTSAVSYEGKVLLAVQTTAGNFKQNPPFYILEGRRLTPVTWFEEE